MDRLVSCVLAMLFVLASVSSIHAQTVAFHADVSFIAQQIGFTPTDVSRVDDDGDGVSDTWLLRGGLYATTDETNAIVFYPRFAIVRTNVGVCAEETFDPIARANAYLQSRGLPTMRWTKATVVVQKDGRRDIVHVQEGTVFVQMRFDRLRCH